MNAQSVTCPDGGYLPPAAGVEKSGHGWNVITQVTHSGVPLCHRVVKLNEAEPNQAAELLETDYARKIRPHLDPKQVVIFNADGNFSSPRIRLAARRNGMLENIQAVSHSREKKSRENARRKNEKRYQIEGYPNWHANGHREIFCACGREAGKRIRLRGNGIVVSRVEGRCQQCGSITITSGDWRLAQNPSRFVRCHPTEPAEKRDWAFGNPLTFNSPEAKAHGEARFGHNEGFHGALASRFGLVAGKRWLRNDFQARTDVAMVYSIIHAISIEQRRQQRAGQSQAPPLALAA